MNKEKFNLDREFIIWYYEEPYPEGARNRSMVHGDSMAFTPNVETRDYWMRESFKEGAKAMWKEINYTLACYATAVEGLDPEMLEPCEVFDRARENLFAHMKQLELFE